MTVMAGDPVSGQFTTRDPITRSAADPDAMPVGVLVVGAEDTAVTVVITRKAEGLYTFQTVIPISAVRGNIASVRASASFGSVSDAFHVWADTLGETSGEIAGGTGSVTVDQDYGGSNNLSYLTSSGAGIAGATVLAYLAADYDAGNRADDYVHGRAFITASGGWLEAMRLTPGDYVLQFYKLQEYGPDIRRVTVA